MTAAGKGPPPPAFVPEAIRPDSVRPADTEVSETTKVPWKRVFAYLLPYWKAEVLLVLGMAVGIGLSLVYPFLLREIVDDVVGPGAAAETNRLLPLAGLILAATTGGVVLSAAAAWLQTWVTAHVLVDLRLELFRHLQALGPAFFARKRLGDVLSRMGGDLAELQQVATGTLINVIGSVVTLVAVATALTILQPVLLVVGAAFIPIAIGLLILLRPIIRRLSLRIRERNADISHQMLESLTGLRTVLAHGLADREAKRFEGNNLALIRAVLHFRLWNSGSAGAFQILVTANLLAVLVIGVWLMRTTSMTPGDLVAFLLFQQRIYGPLQGLAGTYVNLQRAAASVARVFELRDAQPLPAADPAVALDKPFEGRVEFEDVSFQYGPGRRVLTQLSMGLAPGETVCLVGPSGVGKTTVLELLFRFVDPDQGRVLLDGIDLRHLDLLSVLPQVALVGQEPALFDGTLRDNLRWLRPEAPEATLLEVIEQVGLSEFVQSLPQGLETPLGDRGIRLSSGQRQRIGLARALLREPVLLVLDEVTSALDWESDRLVVEALRSRRESGRTTLVISHRLHLATDADRVVVLEDGHVAIQGTHAELLDQGGLYRRLWDLQRGVAEPRQGAVADRDNNTSDGPA